MYLVLPNIITSSHEILLVIFLKDMQSMQTTTPIMNDAIIA